MKLISLHKLGPEHVDKIDLVEYLKRYGEHLLAVKVVQFRKGLLTWEEIGDAVMEVIHENGDQLTHWG